MQSPNLPTGLITGFSRLAVAALVCVLVGSASAAITPIPNDALLQGYPDIKSGQIFVDYDGSGNLHIEMMTDFQHLYENGSDPPRPMFNSFFDVFVEIDPLNGTALSGTLNIGGSLDLSINPVQSLQSTSLTDFGYNTTSGVFQLIFDNAVGPLTGLFGSRVGIILDPMFILPPPQDFSAPFNNLAPIGSADTFALVPEPTSMIAWSIGSALVGLAGWRRTRRRQIKNATIA